MQSSSLFGGGVVKHDGRFGCDELDPEFFFNILTEDVNVTVRI